MITRVLRKLRSLSQRPLAAPAPLTYEQKLSAESQKWGSHLEIEAAGTWNAWLDHPAVRQHYLELSLCDGLDWPAWVKHNFGQPVAQSLDLGCGSGQNSLRVFEAQATASLQGIDVSEARVAEAEAMRVQLGIPGQFWVADVNTAQLPTATYDLIFSCHSFHHFLDLENVMEQVHQALTPNGLFVLEEYVGPTQFQWTDEQMAVVKSLTGLLPERYRKFRWGATKHMEGRPSPKDVVAASPFESIRSADIYPLFKQYFDLVLARPMGGTIQHLLYNGIIHRFEEADEEANRYLRGIYNIEDQLIESGLLPSDFMLLIGKRKS